jgi:hypothetical protein
MAGQAPVIIDVVQKPPFGKSSFESHLGHHRQARREDE